MKRHGNKQINRNLVMKRTLFILLAVLCLNGCMIIDWVPVTFQVRVQDENGKDLLDPANDNTWLIGTHISFNGTSDLSLIHISEPTRQNSPSRMPSSA